MVATVFAPRSWPSRPGLATRTRILRSVMGSFPGGPGSRLLRRRTRALGLVVEFGEHPLAVLLAVRHAPARLQADVDPERDGTQRDERHIVVETGGTSPPAEDHGENLDRLVRSEEAGAQEEEVHDVGP